MRKWPRRIFISIFSTLTLFYVYIYRLSITQIAMYPFVYHTYHPLIPRQSLNLDNDTFRQSFIENLRFIFYHLDAKNGNSTRDMYISETSSSNELKETLAKSTNEASEPKGNNKTREFIPLLTLFSTWPRDRKYIVRNNTVRNWAHFKPLIRPVFFGSNASDTRSMTEHGWDVRPVPKASSFGVPILKYMFMDVVANYKSVYYGYANGDILFTNGLVETLLTVANKGGHNDKPFLIIGKRTNVGNVTEYEGSSLSSVSTIAKARGELFRGDAEDYFITDASFPWEDIPGVVIGRMAYDNWLVMNSRKLKHNVVDATDTILAVHQTTSAGNHEGARHKHTDYNTGLLTKLYKKSIRYGAGVTECALYMTHFHGGVVEIVRRKRLYSICYIP